MKKTPLYEVHTALKGKIIDFGGWALPVQYTSILKEHHGVRSQAGIFDVSHMGEISIKGKGAGEYIQRMVTNDIAKKADGRAIYSPMCYEDGGTVDDLLIYKLGEEDYLLVVNASNTQKDYEWFRDNCTQEGITVENLSEEYALLAIQGPKSQIILQKLIKEPLDDLGFFRFVQGLKVAGTKAMVSRTGYTGELGFELYIPSGDAAGLWERIMEAGAPEGLIPAGLGARDTLRFEAALPLYGQELSAEISPLEAGLGRFVKLQKGDFTGRDSLIKQKEEGPGRRIVGFEMIDRGIARSGYKVRHDLGEIGFVTSGGLAPTLNKSLGMALVDREYQGLGDEITVDMRGKSQRAKIVDIPFYKK